MRPKLAVGWCASMVAGIALLLAAGARPSARSKNHALVLYAHGGEFFIAEAKALAASLQRDGYTTEIADTDTPLVHPYPQIQKYLRGETAGIANGTFLSRPDTLVAHDRLLLAIECDGGLNAGVYRNDTDQVDANGFIVPSGGQRVSDHNACSISSGQIAQLATLAKERGVEMIVIDSSCSGGSSTFVLEPMGVCAVSTAAPGSPAVTGDPPFSHYLDVPFVRTFSDMAVAGGMTIFAQFPERHQQSGYYSTASGHAAEAMTLRAALFALEQSLSGWVLWSTDVYPYVYGAASSGPVRANLAMREPPPRPSSPDVGQVLKMAANFEAILQDEVRSVERRWTQEDRALSAGTAGDEVTAKKVALFDGYRGGEFVTSPLLFGTGAAARGALMSRDRVNHLPLLQQAQIPPTIPFAHQMILRQIRLIETNQRALATNLSTLEGLLRARRAGTPGNPSVDARHALTTILRAETSDRQIVIVLSKLLGIVEDVGSRSDRSPCDVPIK